MPAIRLRRVSSSISGARSPLWPPRPSTIQRHLGLKSAFAFPVSAYRRRLAIPRHIAGEQERFPILMVVDRWRQPRMTT